MIDATDNALQFLLESDPLLTSAAAADDAPASDGPAGYIGSKRTLVNWIWRHTPDEVLSVLDAFSGSAVVVYMYKKQGLRVVANDRLRFAYHIARSITENGSVTLTDRDITLPSMSTHQTLHPFRRALATQSALFW